MVEMIAQTPSLEMEYVDGSWETNSNRFLFITGDLGKVVGSLVTVMTDAGDRSPSLSDEED